MHEPVQKPRPIRWRRLHSTFSFRVKILLGGLAIVLVLSVILIPYFVITSRKAGVVDLGYARYQGQKLKGGITQTLGIRYAAPPVGNLRFAAPQDPITNRKRVQAGNKVIMARFLVRQLVLISLLAWQSLYGDRSPSGGHGDLRRLSLPGCLRAHQCHG